MNSLTQPCFLNEKAVCGTWAILIRRGIQQGMGATSETTERTWVVFRFGKCPIILSNTGHFTANLDSLNVLCL